MVVCSVKADPKKTNRKNKPDFPDGDLDLFLSSLCCIRPGIFSLFFSAITRARVADIVFVVHVL